MLKACIYCGKLHGRDHVCERKPKREYKRYDSKDTPTSKFRSSQRWKNVRDSVYQRDLCLCRVCLNKYGIICNENIEVHHIVPINSDWERRTDESNLISLCHTHHELAESGVLTADYLRGLAAAERVE